MLEDNNGAAITLTPTVNQSDATVEYLNASDTAITDTDTTTPALDAPLVAGDNTFKVKVTAQDDATTETYTVLVTSDTTAPSPESGSVAPAGNFAVFTFDEDLDIAARQELPAAVVDAFTVTADGVDLDIDGITAFTSETLTITLATGTKIFENQTVKLSYDKTVAGTDALEDIAGNEVASFTDFAVTNNSTVVPDTTAPSPESARVGTIGIAVLVIFDEDLDITRQALPARVVNAITVTADGVDLDIDSVDSFTSSRETLTINLPAGTKIFENQTVTLSYDKTVAGADALEDAAGNVGAVLTATDDDNDSLAYFLVGTDSASFQVVTRSGSARILTKAGVTYDHETKSSYAVIVKADDSNGGTDTIAVTITVTDVDEPPARPAAPSVSSVANSTTSLSVTWTAPSTTGRPPIDSYDLRYREGTTGGWTDGPEDVTGTSATISGLRANTPHQVQVLATNDEGDSPWSPSGSGRTNTVGNTAPTFPSSTATHSVAENSPAGTDVGNAVTATDADNDPLTYTLEGTDAASFALVTTAGSAQIRTRSGVTYDRETKSSYAVIVKADDGNGGSDTVTVTINLTDVDEPPRAPAAPTVTATPNTTDSLSVSWRAPSAAGRPAIDSYDLQYREGTTGNWTNGPQNVSGTSATITDLTADPSAYQVQVRATNADGPGDWSPPGRIRTIPPEPPVGPPSPPRRLTATAGDRSVQLSWSRPVDDGGARIVRYEYRQQEGDGLFGTWQIIWEDPPPTDHRVTGLTNGVSYTFQVRAVNNRWAGPATESVSATPGETPVPAVPPIGLLVLALLLGAARVRWSRRGGAGG